MKHRKLLIAAALLLVLAVVLPVLAEGTLSSFVAAGRSLLFETDNVTLTGHAEFSYNGERFKTADILYKQDGAYSHWQLDLLTPVPNKPDMETGYTVVANGEAIYSMEKYHPGVYSVWYDIPCSSVLRRTLKSDAVMSLASAAAPVLETLLPDGAMTVADSADGREIRISLTKETTPDLLNSTLYLAADFFVHRLMATDIDLDWTDYTGTFDRYQTVTEAILHTTDSIALGDTSLVIRMTADGRLAGISGEAVVLLTSSETNDAPLNISFDLSVTDYGSTVVKTFDPAAFGVVQAP